MKHYDLVVLGAGSGNMLLGPETSHLRTAIVEPDRFGGTCLNRGCIPSKMFVVAADAATAARSAKRLGVHATVDHVDWKAIRDRVFGRIDPLHDSAVAYRSLATDVYTEPARFVSPTVVEVGSQRISSEAFVVAVGARPVVPAIPGLEDVPFHTSDTIMRIDEVPESLVIVGGGFIAAELGYVFGALGSSVTIVQRGPRLLPQEDEQVSARFTELAAERHRLLLNTEVMSVEARGQGVAVHVAGAAGRVPRETVEAAALLIAVGRRPNTDRLDAAAAGLELDEHGHIVTDDAYRTSVPGIWSLGDATNHFQLKHMANAEVRVVRHNLLHTDDIRTLAPRLVPHAVFSNPQVASVGLTERQARERGIDCLISVRDYADTAYGWALEDTTGFVKVLADPRDRTLIGAHIIGPQAATLIQPLIQAMTLGLTVDQIAREVLYIHPALTEVVEQALLAL
ncbi:mycothione reductase [Streptomyces sp. NBC_00631]|uniref:mycothione reductase n=1 Tax=Streptomyces sp. NBC_00631 TaxID=2975793 RepID=UPI0030DFD8D4